MIEDPDLARLIGERSLILVGMMGAGKTSVGRRLAERLNRDFIDSDEAIEQAARMPVAEIFTSLGETRFREAEARLVARVLAEPRRVVALGGGAFLHSETRRLAREFGVSIWLDADADILVGRVSRRNTRPLLADGDIPEIIRRLAEARRPSYSGADLHIRSGRGRHEEIVDAICAELARFCHRRDEPLSSG